MPTIHEFASSSDAYDATQCDESVRKGDALLIASEGVVGLRVDMARCGHR
ncbi:hypothetical protein [Stutzerimonas xanthomarina]|nr:hypothetical protein [Stutzerimonas xanthomarina]